MGTGIHILVGAAPNCPVANLMIKAKDRMSLVFCLSKEQNRAEAKSHTFVKSPFFLVLSGAMTLNIS